MTVALASCSLPAGDCGAVDTRGPAPPSPPTAAVSTADPVEQLACKRASDPFRLDAADSSSDERLVELSRQSTAKQRLPRNQVFEQDGPAAVSLAGTGREPRLPAAPAEEPQKQF